MSVWRNQSSLRTKAGGMFSTTPCRLPASNYLVSGQIKYSNSARKQTQISDGNDGQSEKRGMGVKISMYVQRTGYKTHFRLAKLQTLARWMSHQPTAHISTFCFACNRPTTVGSVWQKSAAFLTVRSGLSLSRWFTARMTPDLQGHRSMSPISGGSSPLTQRNRFPTSSGRASTAMAPRLVQKHPPLKKLPNQRHPQSLVIYDIKPARWGVSPTWERKLKNEKSLPINGEKANPGDLNV